MVRTTCLVAYTADEFSSFSAVYACCECLFYALACLCLPTSTLVEVDFLQTNMPSAIYFAYISMAGSQIFIDLWTIVSLKDHVHLEILKYFLNLSAPMTNLYLIDNSGWHNTKIEMILIVLDHPR